MALNTIQTISLQVKWKYRIMESSRQLVPRGGNYCRVWCSGIFCKAGLAALVIWWI